MHFALKLKLMNAKCIGVRCSLHSMTMQSAFCSMHFALVDDAKRIKLNVLYIALCIQFNEFCTLIGTKSIQAKMFCQSFNVVLVKLHIDHNRCT